MATRTLLAKGEAIYSATARRTAGNLALNSTTYADVDTGLDLVARIIGTVAGTAAK